MNYLEAIAQDIRQRVPLVDLPQEGRLPQLFRIYAVLALAVGEKVSCADVHNAWVAWMSDEGAVHDALIPFADLDAVTAEADRVYRDAIAAVARERGL